MSDYKKLEIWKRSVALATDIYKLTSLFPNEEKFGLTAQMRRSVVSISSNIAEGAGRGFKKEFIQFLNYAYGSAYELESQLLISKNLGFTEEGDFQRCTTELDEIQKMIFVFRNTLK